MTVRFPYKAYLAGSHVEVIRLDLPGSPDPAVETGSRLRGTRTRLAPHGVLTVVFSGLGRRRGGLCAQVSPRGLG